MTRFGPWSTLLAIGVAFAAVVAMLLCLSRDNRVANRLLAALLGVFALKLVPYMLGFAGYYDAYPWLSFAPFGLGLAAGPLLYLHVVRLTSDTLPSGAWRHLLPAAIQFAYRAIVFVLPQATKDAWNDHVHRDWIDPLETLLEVVSLAVYLLLALRAYRAYQRWLDAHLSNREQFRITWLRNVLYGFAAIWPLWAGYELSSYTIGFDYFQRFPLYVGFTVLVFYLGLEGWRHAGTAYPLPRGAAPRPAPEPDPPGRDWAAQGRAWMDRVQAAQWWRDPDLGLEQLAQRLGTNTSYVSRALNEGLGLSFNEAINRLRVEAVCAELRAGSTRPLLAIAFDAGFNSKTSFNRCFKELTGTTPSRFRAGPGPEG